MYEVSRRRSKLVAEIQREQRGRYLAQIREEVLRKSCELEEATERESLLYCAFLAFEQQNGPNLDIYINIELILHEVLSNERQEYFVYKLALFLYISLSSSDEVVTYMIETQAVEEWERMRTLLRNNRNCSEYLYERMRVFLQLICAKFDLEPFHCAQFESIELRAIFCEEATKHLTAEPFSSDHDSEYYEFMTQYLEYLPPSHLLPLLLTGFAYETLYCDNAGPSLAILGQLESLRLERGELGELYLWFSGEVRVDR